MKQPTIKQLSDTTGLPQSCFFKLGPDGYGTKRPNTYGIWYRELERVWGITGSHSYNYPQLFWDKVGEMFKTLDNKGFQVNDPCVLSHVHGYLYRKIYFK